MVQAVTCAVELQRGAQEHRSELPEERRLRLRANGGLNAGRPKAIPETDAPPRRIGAAERASPEW